MMTQFARIKKKACQRTRLRETHLTNIHLNVWLVIKNTRLATKKKHLVKYNSFWRPDYIRKSMEH